ncbi:MAG: right-handed parallel beta-helix repeat-containing protein [Phycisphaeraceae bacterium]|nr:right-handed parallel beta-helix repeat-containing protein [Phycisphaeraceae bacterium]
MTANAKSLAIASLILLSGLSFAGPLTPPAGPISSTSKPLSEVEPRTALSQASTPGDVANQFKITQPGSYYLAGDMTASPGGNACILITANDVTLDLNGFTVRAPSAEGIRIGGDRVTIRNGSVALPAGSADAIYLLTGADDIELLSMKISAPSNCVRAQAGVGPITIRQSSLIGGQFGVSISGSDTAVTVVSVECRGQSNSALGLGNAAVVDGCNIRNVGNNGGILGYAVYVGVGSTVRNTSILDGVSAGSVGPDRAIWTASGVTIEDCTIFSRGTSGIRVNDFAVIRRNRVTMQNSGATGIYCFTGDCLISDNSVSAPSGTAVFLNAGTGSTVIRNHLINATTAISGTNLPSNIIGPTASNGNPTANTNPHANFVN